MSGHGALTWASSLLLVLLLVAVPLPTEAIIACPRVYGDVGPCIGYLRGGGPVSPACCGGIRNLVYAARTTADRRAICVCLKTAGAGLAGAKLGFATTLPAKCRVVSPFKITPSIDCARIN